MVKKIEFIPTDASVAKWIPQPVPAIENMPQWYKEMDSFLDGSRMPKIINGLGTNQTMKRCVPFRDGITTGYHLVLQNEINVQKGEEYSELICLNNVPTVSAHHPSQTLGVDIPKEYLDHPYKWVNEFIIKTPKGYSCMFVSPLMHNLPFYTLPAIVDTDDFYLPVHFPFFLRKDFEGVIPKGTPIVQIIPFKRNDWKSDVTFEVFENFEEKKREHFSNFSNIYKRRNWKRKIYK